MGLAWADDQWWPLNVTPSLVELDLDEALSPLKGKNIALVGNSSIPKRNAQWIDETDIVIRMNKGTPTRATECRGTKMDILTCGNIHPFNEVLPAGPLPTLWWFKYTFAGAKQIHQLAEWIKQDGRGDTQFFGFTQEMEVSLVRKLKHMNHRQRIMPSTGLRLLDLLTNKSKCKSITTYGMNFWGLDGGNAISWTSGKSAHQHHSPKAEFALFKKMGFQRQQEGQWFKRM